VRTYKQIAELSTDCPQGTYVRRVTSVNLVITRTEEAIHVNDYRVVAQVQRAVADREPAARPDLDAVIASAAEPAAT
jgi:hypothetical protein